MNGFSFNDTAGASQSTLKPKLEGNKIHTVKIESVEIDQFEGTQEKNKGEIYKVLKITFGNEDGAYQHTVFEPKPADFERTERKFTDKTGKENKIPQPSNVEVMMLLFKHMIDGFVPSIAAQIDSGKKKIEAPDWDTLRKVVKKILEAGKGTENKIKLIKNKKGEGVFPGFFANLSREGSAYVRNNFIGGKVAFTAYEMKRIQDEADAAPKNMEKGSDLDIDNTDISNVEIDLDLDNLDV